jgi:cysteine sulfinate desulfinase/cysteine desulfurase-like protein
MHRVLSVSLRGGRATLDPVPGKQLGTGNPLLVPLAARLGLLGEPWPAWPLIYLDHNATTPIAPEVLDAMMPYLCIALGKEGYRVTYLPVDREDLLKIADLEAAISDETAVLCLMWANNETGVLFPVEQVAQICRSRGVLYHCDAASGG